MVLNTEGIVAKQKEIYHPASKEIQISEVEKFFDVGGGSFKTSQ